MDHQWTLHFPATAGSLAPDGQNAVLLSFNGLQIADIGALESLRNLGQPVDAAKQYFFDVPVDMPGMPTAVAWHPSRQRPSLVLSGFGTDMAVHDLESHDLEPRVLQRHEVRTSLITGKAYLLLFSSCGEVQPNCLLRWSCC